MAWWEIALIVVFGYTALVFLVLLWRAAVRSVRGALTPFIAASVTL